MKTTIQQFSFSGDWNFDLHLPLFARLNSAEWFTAAVDSEHRKKLNSGLVPMVIDDRNNYDPDPEPAQFKAIEFLLNNESQIVESLATIFYENINPAYAKACDEWDWIPPYQGAAQLGTLLGLLGIRVLLLEKDNVSYTEITCNYKGDQEHGISLILHKTQLIGYAGIGDQNYNCVYEDLGIDPEAAYEQLRAESESGANMFHRPLPRYGKFKPWQLSATEGYARLLLRTNEHQKLLDEIAASQWDINVRFPALENNLIDLAVYYDNIEIIKSLLQKPADLSRTILQAENCKCDPGTIRLLAQHGANVDPLDPWGVTPLGNLIVSLANALIQQAHFRDSNVKRVEEYKRYEVKDRERIALYLSLGANPNACNQTGNHYEHLLYKRWPREKLTEHGILKELEKLVKNHAI